MRNTQKSADKDMEMSTMWADYLVVSKVGGFANAIASVATILGHVKEIQRTSPPGAHFTTLTPHIFMASFYRRKKKFLKGDKCAPVKLADRKRQRALFSARRLWMRARLQGAKFLSIVRMELSPHDTGYSSIILRIHYTTYRRDSEAEGIRFSINRRHKILNIIDLRSKPVKTKKPKLNHDSRIRC